MRAVQYYEVPIHRTLRDEHIVTVRVVASTSIRVQFLRLCFWSNYKWILFSKVVVIHSLKKKKKTFDRKNQLFCSVLFFYCNIFKRMVFAHMSWRGIPINTDPLCFLDGGCISVFNRFLFLFFNAKDINTFSF